MAAGPPRRVLLLTAAMGGGHVQVSRELERRFQAAGHATRTVDMLTLNPAWGRFLGWLYPWMVSRAPWLYDAIYRYFFLAQQKQAERASVPVRLSLRGLRAVVKELDPDLVVSTYHLAGVAAASLRSSGALEAPAVTFVTTFGVHDLWLHPATDLYLCITGDVARRLSERTDAPVEICEPVVRPQFRGPAGSAAAASGLKTALVVAGADGMGHVAATARTIASLPGWRTAVVCGRNRRLEAELSGVDRVEVHGWVDDMAGLMGTCDVVVDNAAGSTAKEALAVGCPVVTYRPIAGHGRHDAVMMQEAGLTEVVDEPAELGRALAAATGHADRQARVERGRALFGRDPARLVLDWLEERCSSQAA